MYFPWDIDRTFWEVLCVDHYKLLRNAVDVGHERRPACHRHRSRGAGRHRLATEGLAHRASGQPDQPNDDEGPVRELIPIGEQKVRVRLPEGTQAKKVRFWLPRRTRASSAPANILSVTVPAILDHEVMAIDL